MRAKSAMYIDYIYRGAIEEKYLDRQVYILPRYEKFMSEYKTRIRKLEARITQLCDCLSCKGSRAEGHGRIVDYHIWEVE